MHNAGIGEPAGRTFSKIPVTIVAILTYAVMAGYFTQSGVILGPAAVAFGRSVTDTAALFSYLLGGNVIGIVVSLGIFDVLSIKRTLLVAYGVMFAGIALLFATRAFTPASLGVALVGFGGGLGLSTGAVVISKTYTAQRRATAFLGTDCAFSLTGFIVPPIVATALENHWPWPVGYAFVGGLAALVLGIAARVRFPTTANAALRAAPTRRLGRAQRAPLPPDALVRIGLFGFALSCYLCGQSVFLIWSPGYLQAIFGVSAAAAATVVSSFWGPSIIGLIGAALLVTRVAPRALLLVAMSLSAVSLLLLALATSAAAFLVLTTAFGFVSTCMYKLMISVGSEQLTASPPRLVTFLLLTGSIGGTIAPYASAGVERALGPHAGPFMALAAYTAALVAIGVALALEKSAQRDAVGLPAHS